MGIAVSLAANIAAHADLAAGAGGQLSVELLAHGPGRPERTVTESATAETGQAVSETERATSMMVRDSETTQVIALAGRLTDAPTSVDLDWVAGINKYGRTVLRQWREQGRTPAR